jgi:hypothetical protein
LKVAVNHKTFKRTVPWKKKFVNEWSLGSDVVLTSSEKILENQPLSVTSLVLWRRIESMQTWETKDMIYCIYLKPNIYPKRCWGFPSPPFCMVFRCTAKNPHVHFLKYKASDFVIHRL